MRKFKVAALAAFFISLSACSTVTLRDPGVQKIDTDANWSKSESFFLWGLIGEAHINATQICMGHKVEQMQTQRTFVNSLLGIITFGIYAPRTASVWCAGGET